MNEKYIYGEVRAIPDNVDETRTIDFTISNEIKDRHGTRLMADRWDLSNYKKNPIVGYQHNVYGDALCSAPNPDDIIGKSTVKIEGNDLVASLTFEPPELNPLAEKIFQKVKFGTLRMASVGFIGVNKHFGEGNEAKDGKNPTEYFQKQELLEWSIVNIPSNPTASVREFNVQSEKALRYVAKATNLDIDEIREMTVGDVMKLVNGESIEKDKRDVEKTERMELEEAKRKLKIEQEQKELEIKLNYLRTNLKETNNG